MTDRELLEFAAKAAGRVVEGFSSAKGLLLAQSDGVSAWWNPLTTDGDCARMEAELRINVAWYPDAVICGKRTYQATEFIYGDRESARRRASTRVAAMIGEEMP